MSTSSTSGGGVSVNGVSVNGVSVSVSADDRAVLDDVAAELQAARAELGGEYERHMAAVANMTDAIAKSRATYQGYVALFAKKYVTVAGTFVYRPELGAFVARDAATRG